MNGVDKETTGIVFEKKMLELCWKYQFPVLRYLSCFLKFQSAPSHVYLATATFYVEKGVKKPKKKESGCFQKTLFSRDPGIH
jgi:hypothetical protein